MTTQETTPDAPSVTAPVRRKTSFAGDVLTLVSGTTFAQLLSILATPFLARLFAPEAYGALALFTSITGIIGVVACLRYELAIMLPETDEEAANLLAVSIGFAVLISLLTTLVVWWGKTPLLHALNAESLSSYLWSVPVAVLLGGIFSALNYWNSRTRQYGRLSIARVISSLATTSTTLAAGFAGYTTAGTMIGASIGGRMISTGVLGGQIWRDDGKLFLRSIKGRWMLLDIRRYRKFPLIDTWGALLNNISWQLPIFFLAAFFSEATVGFYAFSFRLIQLPMSLIGTALGQVYYQRASESRGNPAELAKTTEMVFQRLVAMCLLPALILATIGTEAFSLVFGSEWAEAGTYAQILSIWMFFWFVSSPLSTIFLVQERQGQALIVHLAILGSRAVSLLLGGLSGNVYWGLMLFSVSGTVVYGCLTFWNLSLAGVRVTVGALILLRYFLIAFPAIGLLLLLKALGVEPFWLTGIAALELIVYYLIIFHAELVGNRRLRLASSAVDSWGGK